jgi:hypothetical protein
MGTNISPFFVAFFAGWHFVKKISFLNRFKNNKVVFMKAINQLV